MSNEYMSKATPKATASGIPVFCAHDAIVPIEKVIPNPRNPNTHPAEQIKLLGRIIQAAGWRQPITVSNRSGFIVKGHGRLLAAQRAGLTEVPVDYQEYANEAEEYADLIADNRLAELSEIDTELLADIFQDIDLSEIPAELTGYTESEINDLTAALADERVQRSHQFLCRFSVFLRGSHSALPCSLIRCALSGASELIIPRFLRQSKSFSEFLSKKRRNIPVLPQPAAHGHFRSAISQDSRFNLTIYPSARLFLRAPDRAGRHG